MKDMDGFRNVTVWGAVAVIMAMPAMCPRLWAEQAFSLEIATPEDAIQYGDPVALAVKLVCAEPAISRVTGRAQDTFKLEYPELHVRSLDPSDGRTVVYHLLPARLTRCDEEGLEYMAHRAVWWEAEV